MMKRNIFLSLAACAAASFTVPAWAAPQEQVACIYDAFTQQQRNDVAAELTKLISDPGAKLNPAIEKMANSTVEKAAVNCKKRHVWSDQQVFASEDYAAAQIIATYLRNDTTLAGLDFAKIDTAVSSQANKPMSELLMADEPSDANMEEFRKAGIAAGVSEGDVSRMQLVITYLSMKHRSNVAMAIFMAPPVVKD